MGASTPIVRKFQLILKGNNVDIYVLRMSSFLNENQLIFPRFRLAQDVAQSIKTWQNFLSKILL